MIFVATDGGSLTAGFTNEYRDCTVRAVSLAGQLPYATAHALARRAGRKNRRGFRVWKILLEAAKDGLLEYTKLSDLVGCPTLANVVRQYPKGRYIVNVRGHSMALIDGVIHDSFLSGARKRVKAMWKVQPRATITQAQINEPWARLDKIAA